MKAAGYQSRSCIAANQARACNERKICSPGCIFDRKQLTYKRWRLRQVQQPRRAMESYHSVAIIGGGLSGLYAAHLLKERFPDVVVLEAQNRVGGRIKQVHGMAPWPIEAGPEFVHGRNSVFVRFVEQQLGVKFGEKEWPDWWYFGPEVGGQGLINDQDVDDEVDKVHDLFGDCGDEAHPPPGRDQSAAEWMVAKGCTQRQMAVADACYANDFGCSLKQLGVREMIEENRCWDSGETYLLMDRSMGSVITHLARDANVRTSWVVSSISYGGEAGAKGGVRICAADGRVVRCQAALLTVPVTILQQGAITFSPPLPAAKTAALSRVRMGNVVKVVLSFSRRFWREDMYDVVCPGAFAPEFWMLNYPVTNPGAGTPHCVVGFIAGERADEVSALGPEAAQKRFLEQLDEIFGTAADPHPASSCVVKGHVVDWSKHLRTCTRCIIPHYYPPRAFSPPEPFVRGAYSYPSLGAELGDRAALASPVAGRLFFAGEATNEAINPCIQGAMQTAERAAAQIRAALDAVAVTAGAVVRSKL
ncbi:amine oxidase-like protein [Volvox carteri f. nagariensis]|uniref:Amine oxidase-like protein n=1 Tax=Volvox carteri f. nagariensis TaxID=3068 RepID=D8U817_VOLCA|nr:amine oxidase-like protein [Volvox carteri f. nagariensis]EFJ44139.1 amine oxidase-like protein [Volvox carteri f. nagariensis]|eukprot:XP_002954733.1 amine oxidase-like protein [Volvox carteri f. nagariensis]